VVVAINKNATAKCRRGIEKLLHERGKRKRKFGWYLKDFLTEAWRFGGQL
jgi:hypothetical protein